MAKTVIITCAPTGANHTPTMSPHPPITPDEITQASVEATEADAAIIHLHARDPKTRRPDPTAERFMEFLPRIKQGCGMSAYARDAYTAIRPVMVAHT